MNEPLCELCNEPMPLGEEMFNYHGYSGSCPTVTEATTENEPLKEAITKKIYEAMQVSYLSERHDAIKQLFINTLTDLRAEMPTESRIGKGYSTSLTDRFDYDFAFNQAVKQQQDAFKKVLEELK